MYGNIKYDLDYPDDLNARSEYYNSLLKLDNKQVIIAASTHLGEEEIIIKSYQRLKSKFNNLYLILVPRHPHRFDAVHKLCNVNKFRVIKYTDFSNNAELLKDSDILLLNTMGKLLYFYNLADIAFVGGSLVKNIGCHNVLEPAMFKLPIVIGDSYFNYTNIVNNLSSNSAINIAKNDTDLDGIFIKLLSNNLLRQAQGSSAFTEFTKGQGVLEKTLIKLDFLLKTT